MANSKSSRPTAAELAILGVLWRLGPATVRTVHEQVGKTTGYTTILKLMQIMTEKGLVVRDESARTHVYQASAPEDETQRGLVRDLVTRAFHGSATRLVLQALAGQKACPEEVAEIRKMLDSMEGESQ
jgi:predicted transcriptional regulator